MEFEGEKGGSKGDEGRGREMEWGDVVNQQWLELINFCSFFF